MSNLSNNQKSKLGFFFDFISGGVAGTISKTMNAPIERVKLILQTQKDNKQVKTQYQGIIDCFKRCVKEEGFLSLWRGNWANVIRYFPTQALNFSFKEQTNRIMGLNTREAQQKKNFMPLSIIAGGTAGCMTVFFVYPLDFARTRLGVDMGMHAERQFQGLGDCIKKVYKSDGIRGLYTGLNSCLLGIFVYRGLYFGTYDSGKKLFFSEKNEKSILLRLIYAQIVVMFSETISYPLDTIKRRMMMQSARGDNSTRLYKNSIECTVQIYGIFLIIYQFINIFFNFLTNVSYKQEGINGFMKGALSNLIRGYGSAICLVLFDELKKFNKYN